MVKRRRHVVVTELAGRDLRFLTDEDPAVARLAAQKLRDLQGGLVDGEPLRNLAFYGDLSDCFKLRFGLGNPPSHRIVYRQLPDTTIEILEVVAIEARDDAYVYLLASYRVGVLPESSEPKLKRVHQQVIARRTKRRPKPT